MGADNHEVIVSMSPTERVVVTSPNEGDSETVRCMKLFLFACVARRMRDDSFDLDMANWLCEACAYREGAVH